MIKILSLLMEIIEAQEEIQGGGKITFSIEGKVGDGKIKTFYNTFRNKLTYKDKIKKIIQDLNIGGGTISKPQLGYFKTKSGKVVKDTSVSIESLGIDSDTLIKLADRILEDFPAESLLIEDYSTGKKFFYYKN